MTGQFYSYLSPKAENREHPEKGRCGVYAHQSIYRGELIALWGGRVVSVQELNPEMPNFTQRILQIEEDLYLETPEFLEPSDCFNHSCSPNAGMSGQIGLVAIRDIDTDEEICFDYAMCDGSSYDEFTCACGAESCRGRITGADWSIPKLWDDYAGYFSPYIQRRIDMLKTQIKLDFPDTIFQPSFPILNQLGR